MMNKAYSPILFLVIFFALPGCSGKPSKEDITHKLLQQYVCADAAEINNLKILRTEETESTNGPHIFRYTVSGEVEWPKGCAENGTSTPPGTKEKFERLLTLYKSDDGRWE
jgi:hypothetical protein